MVFFAFTTLLGNCFYCDNLLIYIHKKQPEKAFMKGFRLVSALAIFLGAGMEMSLLWDLSDVLMGVSSWAPFISIVNGYLLSSFLGACQPSLFTCLARAMPSCPSGISVVMVDPAAV